MKQTGQLASPTRTAALGASSMCSWCHTMNPTGERECRTCGHRADLPRDQCDCGRPGCHPT